MSSEKQKKEKYFTKIYSYSIIMIAVVYCGKKWGIIMFMGEFHHNMDDKGRLIIPSKFREELGEKFVLTRGIESCLYAYSQDSFEKLVKQLQTLPFTKKDARNFARFFLSGAAVAEFDKQGRINITSSLVTYAGIKKECVIIGVGDRFEIWSSDNWNHFYNTACDTLSDIAENLFQANLDL